MLLRKFLAGFAIASLLVLLVVCVLWMRSAHHVDHFTIPGLSGRGADVTSSHGTFMVISTQKSSNMILQQARFFRHKQVAGWCLLLPALWGAIFLRAKLLPARPGRRPLAYQKSVARS